MEFRVLKKRSKKTGLPPGTLVHIGEEKTESVKITILNYDETQFQEVEASKVEECLPFKDKPNVTWINIDGIHQVDIIEKIGHYFNLHSLLLEDIMNTEQRPKMEDYGDYIFVVMKMLSYDEKDGEIKAEQISLVLGSNYVISFQEREGNVFDSIRGRMKNEKWRIRRMGADYLIYSLIDVIIDNYFTILEKLGEKIEDLEDELVMNVRPETLRSIHDLKREMLSLRKSVWPLREVVNGLERGESSLIHKSTYVYLRDVYDHTIQVIDTIETFRDMLAGMLDIYLSSISNRLNEVMKFLTVIATIFKPLSFLASLWGMNFKKMPELEFALGYPMALCIMVAVAFSMIILFRKKGWL